MQEANDVKGMWEGSFQYSSSLDVGEFHFKARLTSKDGAVSGIIIEDHMTASGDVKSKVEGVVEGNALRFTKQYLEASHEYKSAVEYEGELSASGNVISGTWKLPHDSGTFTMKRSA